MEGEQKEALTKSCLRIEQDCNCSMKTLWNERDCLQKIADVTGYFSAAATAISASAILQQAWQSIQGKATRPRVLLGAVLLEICPKLINGLIDNVDFSARSKKSANIATEYDKLRSEVRHFRCNVLPWGVERNKAEEQVYSFEMRKVEINSRYPSIFCCGSWPKAKEGIEAGETLYDTDKPAS